MSMAGLAVVQVLACSAIAATRLWTSAADSPLARKATTNPAIWASVASPASICCIAQALCSLDRSVRAISVPSTCGQVMSAMRQLARAATRRCSSSPTRIARSMALMGCAATASARDQVASQASCCLAISTRIGGHW